MDILASIRREERKLEKQLRNVQTRLEGLRTATKALGGSAGRTINTTAKRTRKLSAAGRAAISKAAKRRWAKIRAAAKKATS
jgi:hypothetical protein